MKAHKKKFYYDVLLDPEDICNLTRELALIEKGISRKEKLVIYGRRNCGKTSLVKNLVIPRFKKKHPKSFILFADLMQVKDLDSLTLRLKVSFQQSFRESFPKKALLMNIKKYLQSMRPVVHVDPLTGEPSLAFESSSAESNLTIKNIFEIILKRILIDMPGLIILDEFQDISFVPEAEGVLRESLQHYKDIPVIFMGSKKHLLSRIFAKPEAPFADFGSDIIFEDIPYEEYFHYIMERFVESRLKIKLNVAIAWQDLLFRNPEAINIVGAYLVDQFENKEITEKEIRETIEIVVEQRSGRFEEFLSQFSSAQENILTAIAKYGPVLEPSSKDFLMKVKPSHATVLKGVRELLDQAILEKTVLGYHLVNPLLHYYLLKYR